MGNDHKINDFQTLFFILFLFFFPVIFLSFFPIYFYWQICFCLCSGAGMRACVCAYDRQPYDKWKENGIQTVSSTIENHLFQLFVFFYVFISPCLRTCQGYIYWTELLLLPLKISRFNDLQVMQSGSRFPIRLVIISFTCSHSLTIINILPNWSRRSAFQFFIVHPGLSAGRNQSRYEKSVWRWNSFWTRERGRETKERPIPHSGERFENH